MSEADGIIVLNKPVGITSAKALYRLRRITGLRKSGHTGTLDPAAEGVLVICVGKATKLVERIMDEPKTYRATARLDRQSATFDMDGEVIEAAVGEIPDPSAVQAALVGQQGEIEQLPPPHCALKVGGVPAYKLARKGITPELQPRLITIYWTHLHSYDWPTLDFEVGCGRGTYIRSIIRDLGTQLKTGGCLTSLRRTAVGPFRLENAWSFDGLETSSADDYILPLDKVRSMLEGPVVAPPRP